MYKNLFEWPIYIGLIVFGVIVFLFILGNLRSPKKIKIAISKEIEEKLKGDGLVLSEKDFLENKFVSSVGFGGAGGLGSPRVGALDVEDFIKTVKDLDLKWIFYAFNEINNKLEKRYWASTSEGVMLEYRDVYSPENVKNTNAEYSVEEYDDDEVVFKKEALNSFFIAILAGIILGFAAGFISFLLQILYNWIF